MRFERFDSATRFSNLVADSLMAAEAQNNLMIGIIASLARAEASGKRTEGVLLSCVTQQQDMVRAVAVMTPPHNLVLACVDEPAVAALVNGILETGHQLPGVLGPAAQAETLVHQWQLVTGRRAELSKQLRAYQLTEVKPVDGVGGRARPATEDDMDLLVDWFSGFCTDCDLVQTGRDEVARRIVSGDLLLWEDPDPVAMASAGGTTPNGRRVGGVYTPPDKRRRGYATALVAALSQSILDSGKRFCFLFTDLANPTSNSIYAKMGYEPVSDFSEYRFDS